MKMVQRAYGLTTLSRLHWIRKQRRFTQDELAEESGVSRHTIGRAESGDMVRSTTARRLAETLGVRLEDLTG